MKITASALLRAVREMIENEEEVWLREALYALSGSHDRFEELQWVSDIPKNASWHPDLSPKDIKTLEAFRKAYSKYEDSLGPLFNAVEELKRLSFSVKT